MRIKKIERLKSVLVALRNFFKAIHFNPLMLIAPVLLVSAAALLDGLSLGLLVPTLNGLFMKNFTVITNSQIFKNITRSSIHIQPNDSGSIFIILVGTIFLAIVLKSVLLYFSTILVSYQVRISTHNMRKMIFQRYLSFGKLYYDRTGVGHMGAVLGFTTTIAMQIKIIVHVLQNLSYLIIYATLMAVISWQLTAIMFIFLPLLHYPIGWVVKKIRSSSYTLSNLQIELSRKIYDILTCIPLVKAYAREKEENEHFDKLSLQVAQVEYSMDKKLNSTSPISELGLTIMLLLGVSFVAFLFVKQKVGSIPRFLVFFLILRRYQPIIQSFGSFFGELEQVQGPLKHIKTILDDKDKFFIRDGAMPFQGLKTSIEFRKLKFFYVQGQEVLKDISFDIKKGEITAIVGNTGSGKTTLVNLLMRFYEAPQGTIFFDGTDIQRFTSNSLAKHIAIVNQDVLLFNDTIRNNIIYGIDEAVSEDRLINIARQARLYDFIVGLPDKFDTVIGDRGVRLSGGEKQRLSIARAICKNCNILIMDEATSSLDMITERLIQESLNEIMSNRTAIVIAHRLSTIKSADKIVVIERGKLVEQGTLDALLKAKGLFYRYWEEQKFY